MTARLRVKGQSGPDARWRTHAAVAVSAFAVALAATIWAAGRAGEPGAGARQQFRDAGRAYAEGRMPEAVRLYEDLARRGHGTAEVHFNLGNAHAGEGRIGDAVLGYRKAWRLAPRDPDADANLRVALRATGAAEPDLSGLEIVFTGASAREWGAVALVSWWVLWTLAILAALLRGARWWLVRIAAIAGVALAAGLFGLWTWRGFDRVPEVVVLRDTQNALRAPQAAATPDFPLPEGSVVRARERQGEWVRVSHGQLAGWIRRAACAPVLLEAPRD